MADTLIVQGLLDTFLVTQGYISGAVVVTYPCLGASAATACIPLGSQSVSAGVNFASVAAPSYPSLT